MSILLVKNIVRVVLVREVTTIYIDLTIVTSVENCISFAILINTSLVSTTVYDKSTVNDNSVTVVARNSLNSTLTIDNKGSPSSTTIRSVYSLPA